MELCNEPVRGFPGELCQLDKGHRGYHSCVTFSCDGPCGQQHRGTPYRSAYDSDSVPLASFCFICTIEFMRGEGYGHAAPPRHRKKGQHHGRALQGRR
jgi:hypothetical protein